MRNNYEILKATYGTKIAEDLMLHPENIVNYDIESKEGLELLCTAVGANRRILGYLPEYIREDEYIMLSLISEIPQAIDFCSNRLKTDSCFIYRAIKENAMSYPYAPGWVRYDKELSVEAFKNDPNMYVHIDESLRTSLDFAESCFRSNYRLYPALFYKRGFTDSEREYLLNKEIRLVGYMLDLLRDRDRAMRLSAQNSFIAKCIPGKFRTDREFAEELLEKNCCALKYLPECIRSDRELVLKAVAVDPKTFNSATDNLKQDRDFVLNAVRANWYALKYADEFKNDKEIVLEAVKGCAKAVLHIGSELKFDDEFIKMLTEEYPETEEYLHIIFRSRFNDIPA